ncbi:hypothetical protein EDD18DRAFT_1055578, partial [Armillaria luteobubalina]
MFTVFNMIQQWKLLLHTSLKVKRRNFAEVVDRFRSVSIEAVTTVAQQVADGNVLTANTPEEKCILALMKEVNAVSSAIPGSSMAHVAKRNEVKVLCVDQGLASFFITINPADIYNPIVKFLGDSEINVDNMLPEQIPCYWDQSILVAQNPTTAATFFNHHMKAFIK